MFSKRELQSGDIQVKKNTEQARGIETDELKPNDPEFNA
jgi:hypothetical protein